MAPTIDSKQRGGTLGPMSLYHATCVSIEGEGILIRGPSGIGKSALALRLIDRGGKLVSDDQCEVWAEGGQLWARPPEPLEGLLEVRGLGLMRLNHAKQSVVSLIAELKPVQHLARLPEPAINELEGMPCPSVDIDPNLPHADAFLRLALAATGPEGPERVE